MNFDIHFTPTQFIRVLIPAHPQPVSEAFSVGKYKITVNNFVKARRLVRFNINNEDVRIRILQGLGCFN